MIGQSHARGTGETRMSRGMWRPKEDVEFGGRSGRCWIEKGLNLCQCKALKLSTALRSACPKLCGKESSSLPRIAHPAGLAADDNQVLASSLADSNLT